MSKRRPKNRHQRRFQALQRPVSEIINSFNRSIEAVRVHLTSAQAIDAYLALLIDDLWLPNISAQARHALAVSVLVSEKASSFADRRLNTYAEFSVFLGRLHALLPTFPMIDDYVPELDWGQVRVVFEGETYRMMYGGAFERMPDFIEAFRLAKTGGEPGRNDLRGVLTLQDHLLKNITQPSEVSRVDADHLEIPPEDFWARAREALENIADVTVKLAVSPALIARQGAIPRPVGASFMTKFMLGKLLPFALLELEGRRFPISPRSLCAVVIQYWEERETRTSSQLERDTATQTASFMAARFRSADIIPGPMRVLLRHPRLVDLQVPALLCTRDALWVVVIIDVRRAKDLPAAENRLRALIKEDDGLVVRDLATGQILHMPLQGRPADAMRVLAVVVAPIAGASVALSPSSAVRTLFLVDLVSIVESVQRMQDLA